jgi:hypothetical protein
MSKIVKLTEKDLSDLVKKVLSEGEMTTNYMFFSNLQQIARQCKMLLDLDPEMIDEILQDGHDWADDHVSEAKTNMDQVFDFIMNEKRKMEQYIDFEEVNEGRKKTGTKLCYSNGYAVQVCKGRMPALQEFIAKGKLPFFFDFLCLPII